ncbi:MAG: 3-phosphoshikimate 1-carboxyvinyltransferase [candidate division Zixibacteria bacterium]|nr:3-phosphoshikimate 1-carboxyvinyltransferase [candidate division Zixibacteria bacterium]
MAETTIKRMSKLTGVVTVPGDKSISHRAALLSLLCTAPLEVNNYAEGDDCARSLDAVRALGGTVEQEGNRVRLTPPVGGLKTSSETIDCGNSGTTLRLLTGLLAGAGISARLTGDASLRRRPMQRIVEPLRRMNATISAAPEGTPPLVTGPGEIIPIDYILPVASAQVKSALLLAGLASGVQVIVREKIVTRDHTERLLQHLGCACTTEEVTPETIVDPDDPRRKKKIRATDEYRTSVTLPARQMLVGGTVDVPGDFSTAANFIAAGLLIRGSHIILKGVGLNSTRTAFVTILKQMGAEIAIKNRTIVCGEPVGDIEVTYGPLKPRKISGDSIPAIIDEIPLLAVIASQNEGTTIIRDAEELRYKESDRIAAVVRNLKAMGVKIGEFPDGFAIEGGAELNGAEIDSFGDHRIAMAFTVAGAAAHGKTVISGSEAVTVSCPRFFTMVEGFRS